MKEDDMPQDAWSDKREREYEHIKDSQTERGTPTGRAKRIAAATVNKDRARAGEARTASPSSLKGDSPSRRGGKHSHSGSTGRTKEQLYAEAKRRNVRGRSSMSKAQLENALPD
jgi:hypothetical protein